MERGTLRIHTHGPLSEPASSRLPWPWSLLKSALDPAAVVAAYVAALQAWGAALTQSDVVVLLAATFLLFPSEIPLRRLSARVLGMLVSSWLRIALAAGTVWAASAAFALPWQLDARVTLTWLVAAPAAMLLLHAASPWLARRVRPAYPLRKVVVVGVNDIGLRIAHAIGRQEAAGQDFVGFFDDRNAARLALHAAAPVIGSLQDVGDYVKRHGIGAIYISLPMASHPRVLGLLGALRDTTASIHFVPDISVADLIQGSVTTLGGVPVLSVCETPISGAPGAMKRALDLLLVVGSLPVVLPLLAVIALAVRASSPGPAFFRQPRYGLDGKEIVVLKFRTMTGSDDGRGAFAQVTRDDVRVTAVGAVLRRTSLDELPQLINVLLGTMSLVGPRPHALSVNEQFRKLIPGYMVRHKVRPGITGWAQVNGCRGGDDLPAMRRRTEYDLAYLRSWSVALDLLIIVRTVRLLVFGDKHAF
ncbi:undecaprenyl-phosphate glucose phosphotransferase [Ramlibacter sp. PS4R-6]|uniref:undecaprenyl-phosphate glucose phosphotransferase n=1 Tax=Ramlibacter sp. PS4R-6 TaxID=3133438 RepID=UPI0030A0E3DE